MKIIFLSDMTDSKKAYSYIPQLKNDDVKFLKLSESTLLAEKYSDTQVVVLDAMGKIDSGTIKALPALQLIQSEGVGYQGVDVAAAKAAGVTVCNNRKINDTAVAEHTVMLILTCLKDIEKNREMEYSGQQLSAKRASFGKVRELSECTVGLVGLGDIAKCTARLLKAFGCKVVYSNRTRYEELESQLDVQYVGLDELLKISDFVSLHLASNSQTQRLCDKSFLGKMKNTAYLINTSRGELVDNDALHQAVKNGDIAGAGLDVIAPEPVSKDNVLLSDDIKGRMIITPHIAGITSLTMKKAYKNIYDNIENLKFNRPLKNVVDE